MGWNKVYGTATRYGVCSPKIESQWGQDFLHPSMILTAVQKIKHPVFHIISKPKTGKDS
jgi:hypothetical protein